MSTTIKLICIDQVLAFESTPVVASGGLEEDFIQVDFCSKWDGMTKTAVFWRSEDDAYHVLLDAANSCAIPREVLADEGVIYFGLFGVNTAGKQRTSQVMRYNIAKGAITEGTKPTDPTPDIYTDLLAKYSLMVEITADTRVKEQAFEQAMTKRQKNFEEAMGADQESYENDLTQRQEDYENDLTQRQEKYENDLTQRQEDYEVLVMDRVTEKMIPDKSITEDMLKDDVLVADNVKVPYGTAAALGVFTTPNVEAALYQLNEAGVPKIGDTVATHRTDLGENWALCDGSAIESDLPFLTLEGFTRSEAKNVSGLGVGTVTLIRKVKKLSDGRFLWLTSVYFNDNSEYGYMQVTEPGALLPSASCGKLSVQSTIHGGNFLNGKYIQVGRYTDFVSVSYSVLKFTDNWPLKDNEATVVLFTDDWAALTSITYDEQQKQYVAINSNGALYYFNELTDETRTKVTSGLPWGASPGIQLDYLNGQLFAYGSGGVYRSDKPGVWVKVASTTNAVDHLEYHNGCFYFSEHNVGVHRTSDFSTIETVPESQGLDIFDFHSDRIVLTGSSNVLVMMDEADFGNLSKSDTKNTRPVFGTVSGDTFSTVSHIEYNGATSLYEFTVCTANLKNRLLPTVTEGGVPVYLKIADDRLDNVPDFEVEPLPTHASTHAAGGPDAITPKMIGAATPTDVKNAKNEAVNTAKAYTDEKLASAVENFRFSWNDLTDKPFGGEARVEIFPPTRCVVGNSMFHIDTTEPIIPGETYVVTMDGVDYTFTAVMVEDELGDYYLFDGKESPVDDILVEDLEEPCWVGFHFYSLADGAAFTVGVYRVTDGTIAPQYLPCETWTFTLDDGTVIEKKVVVAG